MPSLLNRYIPGHFQDPLGLVRRLLSSNDSAARYAMGLAAAGLLATPLDAALLPFERSRLRAAGDAAQPVILVCGPPRSGTTVLYQTLAQRLPVAYFNNLTALFPRSPLTALTLFGRFLSDSPSGLRSFYGRTSGLAGSSDALYLWDRWLGEDRTRAPEVIAPDSADEMRRFFAACAAHFGRPLVGKNNSLNASAHQVAEHLPQARFLCLHRGAKSLARSLYRARCDIHGSPDTPYGLAGGNSAETEDPVRSVCEQVAYFDQLEQRQLARLGGERFRVVAYEAFCRNPEEVVDWVAREWLGGCATLGAPRAEDYRAPRRKPLDPGVERRLDEQLASLGLLDPTATAEDA